MLRFCQEGGELVGSDGRLADDPSDYDYGGCNRIRCQNCGAMVRVAPPGVRKKDGVRPDLARYPFDDWLALPFLERSDGAWRFYACKCRFWETAHDAYLVNDHESPTDPNVPWSCAGHPPPSLPVTLGPIAVGEKSDFDAIVQQIVDGACPRPLAMRGEGPGQWLKWLYNYLIGLPAADRLGEAIGRRIGDRDPKVVGRVLFFYRRFPTAAGVEPLLARAEQAPDRIFDAARDPDAEVATSLWDVLLGHLALRGEPEPLDARVVALVRKAVLAPADPDRVKLALEKNPKSFDDGDLQWLAENIVAIDEAGSGRWRAILGLLVYWLRRERETGPLIAIAGVAIIQSGRVPPSEIRAWMKERGTDRDEWVPVLEASLTKRIKAAP